MEIPNTPKERHPFEAFTPANATILIVGSFPGREQTQTETKEDDWFYGAKRNYFWKIISRVYDTQLTSKNDKQKLFEKFGIGITDIFLEVQRKKDTNNDNDLHVVEFNDAKIKSILQKENITSILFTSEFVQGHFLAFFPFIKNYDCLLSPSPLANRTIFKSQEFINFKKENPNSNTIDFRIRQYKKLLKA